MTAATLQSSPAGGRVTVVGLARAWVIVLVFLSLGGCEEEMRVPYIPPVLANWPQPYRGVHGLTVHVFNSGYVRQREALVLRGGRLTHTRDLPVPVFVIAHPQQGLILFNTGLTAGTATDAAALRGWMSLAITSTVLPGEALEAQMQRAGLKPEAVRWIVLSNLRAAHTGAAEAFPQARVVVAQVERAYAGHATSGYAPGDVDDITNWQFVDFDGATPLGTFAAHIDLFGDGSCLLIDAAGVTPGTMAMLVRLVHQPVLLAGDMAAVTENVRYAVRPAAAADPAHWWDHIWRLKRFKDLVPALLVAPGSDLGPLQAAPAPDIVIHEIRPPNAPTPVPPTPDAWQRAVPKPM